MGDIVKYSVTTVYNSGYIGWQLYLSNALFLQVFHDIKIMYTIRNAELDL